MDNISKINDKWIKASLLGTIWASSEIVLGSFLHNLKIPFSGNILTAIALILLISASFKLKEKGIFWRAGLISALLKTMSPSAAIFGPMIAIISEALLFEITIFIFGRTLPGYIFASILAMSWVLFQKIATFILFYGYNIVEVYESLMQFAIKQLNIEFNVVWTPIIILFSIYAILGIITAIIGIKTGKNILAQKNIIKLENNKNTSFNLNKKKNIKFKYSIVWIILNIVTIISLLIIVNYIKFYFWATFVVIVILIWTFRYKQALRQLMRPKFWIFFIFITMATSLVFTKFQSTEHSLWYGVMIGIEMNLRAILLIIGFSVVGTELHNPRIRRYFMQSNLNQLSMALEISLNSLPSTIKNLPDVKSILKNPIQVISNVILQSEERLMEIKTNNNMQSKIHILTGAIGQGKTTLIKKIIDKLKVNNIKVGGIYSPRIIKNNKTIGYDIVNIFTNKRSKFLRIHDKNNTEKIGKYFIINDGLDDGLNAIMEAIKNDSKIIIIDEIGKLEMDNKGWSEKLENLFLNSSEKIILVVRQEIIADFIKKYNLKSVSIYNTSKEEFENFCNLLIQNIIK